MAEVTEGKSKGKDRVRAGAVGSPGMPISPGSRQQGHGWVR